MPVIRDPEGVMPDVLHTLANFDGMRVLEIGCGEGHLTWQYAGRTRHVTALDPTADKIAAARANAPARLAERVRLIESNIEDFGPPTGFSKLELAVFGWSL